MRTGHQTIDATPASTIRLLEQDDDLLPATRAARAALVETDNNSSEAIRLIVEQAKDDAELRDGLIAVGARHVISAQIGRQRDQAWVGQKGTSGRRELREAFHRGSRAVDNDNRFERVVALAHGNLFTFPLPGGKRLGDAVKSEVESAATDYEARSSDASFKSRWLRLVAKAMKSNVTRVSSAISEAQLNRLREEAMNATA